MRRWTIRIIGGGVLLVLVLALTILVTRPVVGQAPPSLVGQPLPPPGSPVPRMEPPQLPSVAPGGMKLTPIEEGEVPETLAVPVSRVEVFPEQLGPELRPFTDGLTGPSISVRQLNDARQRILLHYRERGYALTTVSLDIDRDSGLVRYTVVEGHIADVVVTGETEHAGAMVKRFLDRLKNEPVINTATLERYLLLAQDVPGVNVTTVLAPSKTERGALTLIAHVSVKTITGQVSFDNRAFALTGPIEGLAAIDLNGMTAWGDKTEVSYYHSFPHSQDFGQLSSEWFIFGASGARMKIYGGAGASVPTGSLAALRYIGTTDIFGAQISYPWIRSRQQNLSVGLTFDALESTIYTGSPSAQASADEVRALRVSEDYVVSDNLLGELLDYVGRAQSGTNSRPATDVLTTRLSRGLDFLGGFHGTALPPSTARPGLYFVLPLFPQAGTSPTLHLGYGCFRFYFESVTYTPHGGYIALFKIRLNFFAQ